MILRGDIIAYNNKEHRKVLYPRGEPFVVPLSGNVVATSGRQVVSTNAGMTKTETKTEIDMVQNQAQF